MSEINEPIESVEVEPIEVVEAPVEIAPAPVAVPEPSFEYRYTPQDEHGRKLGSEQVFKGRNAEEVLAKVAEANKHLIQLNRNLTKKIRLGQMDPAEEMPENARRFAEQPTFSSQELTADERVELSRDLLDPERFDAATNRLFEAKLGMKPEVLRTTLQEMQETNQRLTVKTEADAFVANNPGYYPCRENLETIVNWILKQKLAMVRENIQYAYDTLKAAGLLLEAPMIREAVAPVQAPIEPVTQTPEIVPAQEEVSRITEPKPANRRPAAIASGLSNKSAASVGTPPKSGYTLEEINRMSSAQLLHASKTVKGFDAMIDRLEKEAFEKRQANRQ
jgi:hypothetical protein